MGLLNPDLPSSQAFAVGLIAVGIGAQLVLNQTITPGATPGSLLPVVIIAVGAFLFLVAFVGCCGACKENYCLMITVSGCGPAWVPGTAEGHFSGGGLSGWVGEGNLGECSRDQQAPLTQTPNVTPVLCICSLPSSCPLSCWWRWLQPLLAMCLETK